jgi:predicted CXXCH cytochrome family protein
MLLADQKGTCLRCHEKTGKEAAAGKSVHAAFSSGDCSKCHSPHQAKLKTLLLASSPDLCLTCHKKIGERLLTQKVHRPADDCLTCHKPHASAQRRLAVQPLAELCSQCHDVKDKGFATAHLGIDPGAMDCVSCHDPHASKDPKFFKAIQHAPFAGRQCDACHATGGK